jgi:hypothetical protein
MDPCIVLFLLKLGNCVAQFSAEVRGGGSRLPCKGREGVGGRHDPGIIVNELRDNVAMSPVPHERRAAWCLAFVLRMACEEPVQGQRIGPIRRLFRPLSTSQYALLSAGQLTIDPLQIVDNSARCGCAMFVTA